MLKIFQLTSKKLEYLDIYHKLQYYKVIEISNSKIRFNVVFVNTITRQAMKLLKKLKVDNDSKNQSSYNSLKNKFIVK